MVFENCNCNFNYWFYEHSRSILFKNCTFNAPIHYHAKPQIGYLSIISFLRFDKCTFNNNVTITDIKDLYIQSEEKEIEISCAFEVDATEKFQLDSNENNPYAL